jgi:predicted RNA binding protein YcfA (HicA-like mRNA interferase family)
MKLPRDLSGIEFVKLLSVLGYEVTRQTGSHIRLTTQINGEHHITIPNHNPIKVGTLSNILSEIADHFKLSKEELNQKIFNN